MKKVIAMTEDITLDEREKERKRHLSAAYRIQFNKQWLKMLTRSVMNTGSSIL